MKRKDAADCRNVLKNSTSIQDVNAELNLRSWLQFIFFRLSIFNEVISFSIKHISVRSNRIFRSFIYFSLFAAFFCFFQFDFRLRIVESKSNYLSLCIWLSWFCSSARDFHCYIPSFSLSCSPFYFIRTNLMESLSHCRISWKRKIWLKLWLFVIDAFLITLASVVSFRQLRPSGFICQTKSSTEALFPSEFPVIFQSHCKKHRQTGSHAFS